MNNVDDNKQKAGFTLIEVLLTIVIIAIGLLGLAGLQVATVNNQFDWTGGSLGDTGVTNAMGNVSLSGSVKTISKGVT